MGGTSRSGKSVMRTDVRGGMSVQDRDRSDQTGLSPGSTGSQ